MIDILGICIPAVILGFFVCYYLIADTNLDTAIMEFKPQFEYVINTPTQSFVINNDNLVCIERREDGGFKFVYKDGNITKSISINGKGEIK